MIDGKEKDRRLADRLKKAHKKQNDKFEQFPEPLKKIRDFSKQELIVIKKYVQNSKQITFVLIIGFTLGFVIRPLFFGMLIVGLYSFYLYLKGMKAIKNDDRLSGIISYAKSCDKSTLQDHFKLERDLKVIVDYQVAAQSYLYFSLVPVFIIGILFLVFKFA